MVDRVRGYVIGARGFLTWTWPFLLAAAVTANLVVLPILVVRQAEVLHDTQEATELNRRMIRRGLPCLEGDPPSDEACIVEAIRLKQVADGLALVQEQHDAQSVKVDDAVARLVELQGRIHGIDPTTVAPVRPRTTTTTVRPRVVTTASTARAAAATTTTTVCKPPACKPNKP